MPSAPSSSVTPRPAPRDSSASDGASEARGACSRTDLRAGVAGGRVRKWVGRRRCHHPRESFLGGRSSHKVRNRRKIKKTDKWQRGSQSHTLLPNGPQGKRPWDPAVHAFRRDWSGKHGKETFGKPGARTLRRRRGSSRSESAEPPTARFCWNRHMKTQPGDRKGLNTHFLR